MFVFLFVLLPKIVFALPRIEELPIANTDLDGSTSVPSHQEYNVEKSSNELQKAVNSLQTAIQILFPKKNHQEKDSLSSRQSPFIRCLISKVQLSAEEKKLCHQMYRKTSEDETSKEENALDDSDDSSVESNEEMQKPSVLNNILNRSRSPQTNLDTINLNRKQSDYGSGISSWLSNFHPVKETMKKVLDMKNMAQSNENDSTDRNLNLIRVLSRIYQQSMWIAIE